MGDGKIGPCCQARPASSGSARYSLPPAPGENRCGRSSQARRKDRNAQGDEERRTSRLVFKTEGPPCTISDGAFDMLSPAERALLTEKQDRLIELLVLHDEATKAEDWGRVRSLETKINAVKADTAAFRPLA